MAIITKEEIKTIVAGRTSCRPEQLANGHWRCPVCGKSCNVKFAANCLAPDSHNPPPPLAEIIEDAKQGAEKLGEPSLVEKGSHYITALAKWTRAGFPTRTPIEAAACEAICQSNACGEYDAEAGACKVCGCRTSAGRWAIFSKTKMKTEVCPKGFWR